jgi:hypothetical protein
MNFVLSGIAVVVVILLAVYVFCRLLRRGPQAAAEAVAQGYSLRTFWSGKARPGQKSGTGLAGRVDPELGIVAIETDVSPPRFLGL